MSLVNHARRELEIAGLFDKDSDHEGMLGHAVLRLIEVFAEQGHSGFSAGMTRSLFAKLANFENLTPLTSDRSTWNLVCDERLSPEQAGGIWQSQRNPEAFSEDDLGTYYLLSWLEGPDGQRIEKTAAAKPLPAPTP